MGPGQLAEVLRQLPRSVNPNLLVGFETSDDAGIFRLSDDQALVQTVDFFTPIVDDPYAYGQIAAANALSDVYAMGGRPISVLNIACFSPELAPPEFWAAILKGAYDKTTEAGAVVMGGHSVEDKEPKFGMAVTGLVDPNRMFANTEAKPGDGIWLTKPLGTGIVTTAAKFDACLHKELDAAITSMSKLNKDACEAGQAANVRCATDITGFSLCGHLFNVARASKIAIQVEIASLPILPGVERMVTEGHTTGGAKKNRDFLGDALHIDQTIPDWLTHLALDPQTSGGLALFSTQEIPGAVRIGRVVEGLPSIHIG
ncbi:MAG: selenide, water dikinase SelD [Chlorobia bacterium]|nr:selenide, water dikinase SelD [Fimbriimonadaceae bacterium]